MAIRSDEITSIIRSEIKGFDEGADVAGVGTIVEVGDGIAQIFGLSGALASELLEFPGGVMGMAFNLEEETVGALILGDYTELKEGDQVKTTGRVVEVPVGDALIGRVVNPLGEPHRRQGPHRHDQDPPGGAHRPGRHRAPAGRYAGADRHQGHRRHDPHRPRPARADHRRPPDGQDGDRGRHDHQPEGPGPDLHLRRHRPEAVDGGPGGGPAGGERRDGALHRGDRLRVGPGPAAVPGPLRRRGHGRRVPGQRARRALRLRRPVEARLGLPPGLAADAPPARPRGVPGRHLLFAQPPAGARGAPERGERRRLADGAAGDRDAGRRRVRLHPDQRDLDHGRADLPADRPVQPGPAAGGERRHQRLARGRQCPDQGHAPGRRQDAAGPGPVPRAGGLRPVRVGPRQGHPRPADPRREGDHDPAPAAVLAAVGREPGGHHLDRHQRLAGRHRLVAARRVRDGLLPLPGVDPQGSAAGDRQGEGALRRADQGAGGRGQGIPRAVRLWQGR